MTVGWFELAFWTFMILFTVVPLGVGIWVATDAGGFPEWAFQRAATSKPLWTVLPWAGTFACGVVPIGAAVMWFGTYKARVAAAAQYGPPPAPPPSPWGWPTVPPPQ